MMSIEELKKRGLYGKKITFKDPETGKMRSFILDGVNYSPLTKEEQKRVRSSNCGTKTKVFSERMREELRRDEENGEL